MNNFLTQSVTSIKDEVQNKKVICALSGGVDSSVVAALLAKAISKDNLYCVFIDTGMLRKNEIDNVKEEFKRNFDLNLIIKDNSEKFFDALKGVTDPEEKRKIIGKLFIESFQEIIADIGDIDYLAQGTIYPDVIESLSGSTETIKSHHNVGGLPSEMYGLKLIEPIKTLFKDEVRKLGYSMGLSESLLKRHPFPGPGLGIRIIGEVTKEKCDILREADNIFITELINAKLYDNVWQAYVALLPVYTVGVMGDSRTYQQACVLRAVNSVDGMTANASKLPHEFLTNVANKIVNQVAGINRVFYDITSKPPATIEME